MNKCLCLSSIVDPNTLNLNLSYFYPCGSNGIRIHNTVFSLTFKSQPSMQTAEMVEFGKEFLIWIRKINSDPNVLGSATLTNKATTRNIFDQLRFW